MLYTYWYGKIQYVRKAIWRQKKKERRKRTKRSKQLYGNIINLNFRQLEVHFYKHKFY